VPEIGQTGTIGCIMTLMPQTDHNKEPRKGILGWSWTGFDLLLVIGALLAGLLVWFLPSFSSSPELQAFYARQKELKEGRLAREAEEARIRKENEELGLVYIQPGTNPFPTRPPDDKKSGQ
jgi:hypothetical protein